MKNWWIEPIRAVTLEFPASDVATIDIAGIVDELHQGSVNTICVFSTGYYPGGTAFYQSKIAPLYPGLGTRDLLAETIEAARRNGQKVIAYIASIWGGREMFEAHPDWVQRQADGSVTSWDDVYTSVAMCPNSPYREYLASVVRELSENYDLDGFYFDEPSFQSWCTCSYCQEKFYAEYHQPLPTESRWGDPVFQKFVKWRYEHITQWRKALYDLVKREDRCVFPQGAFPFTSFPPSHRKVLGIEFPHPYVQRFSGVPWYIPMGHAADMSRSAEVGDVIHFELYRRSVREPLWWYGLSLRYGQAIAKGKPILTLSMMAQTPFELYGMAEAELRLSVAELLANSSAPLFARYYPDRVDQDAWNLVYDRLREAKALEPYLVKRESVKYAAVLFSDATLHRFDYVPGRPAHLNELKGFAKALLQEHILFDIITEANLPHVLGDYKVLVLPNATCLSEKTKQAIRQFVENGGGVVASYESGMYNESGSRTPEDDFSSLFGLTYAEQPPSFAGFDVYMRMKSDHDLPVNIKTGKQIPTGGIYVGVVPAGAKSAAGILGGSGVAMYGRLGDESGQPGILTHSASGLGRTVLFTPPLGNVYLDFGAVDHLSLIASAVRWAAGSPVGVDLDNAPQTMALTAFYQPESKRTVVHLVNSVRDEIMHPISYVVESGNVQLKVAVIDKPRDVIAAAGCSDLSWSLKDHTLIVTIPSVRYHAVIAIEQ